EHQPRLGRARNSGPGRRWQLQRVGGPGSFRFLTDGRTGPELLDGPRTSIGSGSLGLDHTDIQVAVGVPGITATIFSTPDVMEAGHHVPFDQVAGLFEAVK